MIMARRYRVRHGGVTYTSDPHGMGDLMTGSVARKAVDDGAQTGYRYLQGASGYEDVTIESFEMRVFGEQRAVAAIYNATPGGVAADARYGLFSQVVSAIEAQYG